MSFRAFSRPATGRERPAARRRASSLQPTVDRLEGRVVLSHATALAAPMQVPAMVHTLAGRPARLNVPLIVTGADVTGITRSANGVVIAVGNLTGTLLGIPFSTPMTATITPARNARSCPVLNLNIQPIGLSLLGLNVNTGPIGLNINARRGGGPLGNLLCGGLNDVLSSVATDPTTATGTLNAILDSPQAQGVLNAALGRTRARLAPVATPPAGTCPVLNLSQGPVRLNLLGLNVKLDNRANGPVNVRITGTAGVGPLGDLLCSLSVTPARGLSGRVGTLLQQINGAASGLA